VVMDGDASASSGTEGAQGDADMSTVYNGSIPCIGCGVTLDPVAAMYAPDKRCHSCRRKRHHKHIKGRMAR
jgi:hypothetical protein